MRGYDEYNTILLPPRGAGEKIPQELQDYYDEQLKKLEEEDKVQEEAKPEDAKRSGDEKDGNEDFFF